MVFPIVSMEIALCFLALIIFAQFGWGAYLAGFLILAGGAALCGILWQYFEYSVSRSDEAGEDAADIDFFYKAFFQRAFIVLSFLVLFFCLVAAGVCIVWLLSSQPT